MSNVTIAALKTVAGDIIEAELEMEYDDSIWEMDIVNDTGRVVKVVVDAQSG
ncbi:MAG: PepSY domain-containing protein [Granulosicoccus sp.]